jgi:RNA polymerase sigma factor (sigma-70 family)
MVTSLLGATIRVGPDRRPNTRDKVSRFDSGARRQATCDDTSLIAACVLGDEGAWEVLVNRYSPLVYSIPRRFGFSTADAEDVLQNVFTIVFRRLNSLKNHTCLVAWLITITRRECLHYCRQTPEHAELLDEIADDGIHPSDTMEARDRRLLVHRALEQLDASSQALLGALFLEIPTPSYTEIARRLGLAVGSIGPARARSLKRLETVLLALDPELVTWAASAE